MTRGIYLFIASEFKPLKCTSGMGAMHIETIAVDIKVSNISAWQQIVVSTSLPCPNPYLLWPGKSH